MMVEGAIREANGARTGQMGVVGMHEPPHMGYPLIDRSDKLAIDQYFLKQPSPITCLANDIWKIKMHKN